MKRLVEFPTEDGGSLLVEVDDDLRLGSGPTFRGGPGTMVIEKARVTYEEALENIKGAAETIISKMRTLSESPNEISVEFGIKLSADVGAILASTSAEAQFTLSLTWKRVVPPAVEVVVEPQDHAPASSQEREGAGGPDA
jgi:hypothetical protein